MAQEWREPEGEKFALGSVDEQAHWQAEYTRIVNDVRERAQGEIGEDEINKARTLGLRLPRADVLYKVRGRARYAANISMDGMLHARFVRSPEPHARILKIDVSKAENAPGVRGIITAKEIPDDRLLIGTLTDDTPVLARDKVRYATEPVVAIAADTVQAAEQACQL
ncbi:MAG: hypothetical protein O7G83_20130, partial [Proteobacteria bacterium]|nr:hypothetical protein [Pseudomonadota bacterium]